MNLRTVERTDKYDRSYVPLDILHVLKTDTEILYASCQFIKILETGIEIFQAQITSKHI